METVPESIGPESLPEAAGVSGTVGNVVAVPGAPPDGEQAAQSSPAAIVAIKAHPFASLDMRPDYEPRKRRKTVAQKNHSSEGCLRKKFILLGDVAQRVMRRKVYFRWCPLLILALVGNADEQDAE